MNSITTKTLIVCFLAGMFSTQAGAVILFDTDYVVQTHAVYDTSEAGTMRKIAFGPDDELYVSHRVTWSGRDGSVYKVSNGSATPFVTGMVHPTGIASGAGTAFGDYLYVSDGIDKSTWDKGHLTRIDLDGNVSTFSGGYMNEPFCIGIDRYGNYGGDMYVGSGSHSTITRLSPAGEPETFYSFGSAPATPFAIAFDATNRFGGLMYVGLGQDETRPYSGIINFDPDGNIGSFAPQILEVLELKFDETGLMFGGDMYVHAKGPDALGWRIYRVSPDGSTDVFAHLTDGNFTFGPDGAMYAYEQVGNTAVISKVFVPEPATVLLIGLGSLIGFRRKH